MKLALFVGLLIAIVHCNDNSTTKYKSYYWRDYKGRIPDDAFNVTEDLYIGQVLFDSILIGGYYAGTGAVITEYDGKRVVVKDTIKFLCGSPRENFEWELVNLSDLSPEKLENMVIGGFEKNSITYIGRIFHEGQWKIGKVFPPSFPLKGLIAWRNDDGTYTADEFEILKYLNK